MLKKIILLLSCLFILTACAPNISPDQYTVGNVGVAQAVSYGKIVKARVVDVSAKQGISNSTLVGTTTGITTGSMIGNTTRLNILGGLAGAVVGGVMGNQIGKGLSTQKGMEYIVRMDGGKTISIVQGLNPLLKIGQRVMLLSGGNSRDRLVAA